LAAIRLEIIGTLRSLFPVHKLDKRFRNAANVSSIMIAKENRQAI
jgi:hypothetical protein